MRCLPRFGCLPAALEAKRNVAEPVNEPHAVLKILRHAAGVLLAAIVVAPLVPFLQAADKRPGTNPLVDVVAVGRAPGRIVLATPAEPLSQNQWRYRTIALASPSTKAERVELSRSGTKLLLVLSDGRTQVVDLTQKVTAIGDGATPVSQHRLPGQFFTAVREGKVCLVDDLGQVEESRCREARGAALHEDGREFYANASGMLFVLSPRANAPRVLSYELPMGGRYELLAGQHGDARDFLVLVGASDPVAIVDPVKPGVAAQPESSWTAAGLKAQMLLAGGSTALASVEALAVSLEKGAPGGPYEWSFFRVRPEVALYAPVLQFAPDENVLPADVNIWSELGKIGSGKTQPEYETVYAALGEQRLKRCTVYYRTRSYGGSWLVEYWYYYPFDEGHPNQHIHDSEHLFLEVDKLGGTVRSVLASSHDQFAPNNNYSTLEPGAAAVPLPVYAMVEQRKHAMSPDINRDSKFERGVDVNLYKDKNAFWGVRDLGGFNESFMRPYKPEMTLPREKKDRMALASQSGFFPGLDVPEGRQACGLVPFPEESASETPANESAAAAVQHLNTHSDARKPQDIYKPWVLPYSQWRVGLGIFDRDGLSRQLYFAYVRDIRSMTRRGIGPSGRLALELMWAPVKHRDFFTVGTQTFTERLSNEMYAGVRYERLLTNSQGFYGGVTPHFRRSRLESVNGVPLSTPPEWDYDGVWYRLGYIIELPFRTKGNMAHHVGIVFHPRGAARFEWRISFGFLRHRGRDSFGLRPGNRNPYQEGGQVE